MECYSVVVKTQRVGIQIQTFTTEGRAFDYFFLFLQNQNVLTKSGQVIESLQEHQLTALELKQLNLLAHAFWSIDKDEIFICKQTIIH